MPVDWNNMLEAIAFYSQEPNSYFQYWWFSHNDNCSHDEQGALSASQEQQIRQMVSGWRGSHFQNVSCGEDSGLKQGRIPHIPFFQAVSCWWDKRWTNVGAADIFICEFRLKMQIGSKDSRYFCRFLQTILRQQGCKIACSTKCLQQLDLLDQTFTGHQKPQAQTPSHIPQGVNGAWISSSRKTIQ